MNEAYVEKEDFLNKIQKFHMLAFYSDESIYLAMYSNRFLKLDMDLSNFEAQMRNGKRYSIQNPLKPEEEEKEGEIAINDPILGIDFIESKGKVFGYYVNTVKIFDLHSRKDM